MPFILYAAGCIAGGLSLWVRTTFGDVSVEQILYHVVLAENAAVHMSGVFALEFTVEVLAIPLLVATLAAWLHAATQRRTGGAAKVHCVAPPLALMLGAGMLVNQVPVVSYAAAWLSPDGFATAYVDPARVLLPPGPRRRNLVLVYAESLERTFTDKQVFGTDLLAPLSAVGGKPLADYRQVHGTGWTMGGIVGTQCGVPLLVSTPWDVSGGREGSRAFLGGATCLGDLLQAQGYRNVFLGGAALSFAGKGAFLRTHGYQEVWGQLEWHRAGVGRHDVNAWGLTDHALLLQARARLDSLRASGEPFNLTILTMDMHGPQGFLSDGCARRGASDYRGIVECTGHQLAEFARHVVDQGYLNDTVLVIVGDHLMHGNPFGGAMKAAAPQRRLYGLVLAEPIPLLRSGAIVPFDLLPTLLELLGTPVPGGRLALGLSAVQAEGRPGAQLPDLDLRAVGTSASYRRLWQHPPP